eukprot:m51a1_g11172 hypothetical protein (181) ;mRNA; r:308309-309087
MGSRGAYDDLEYYREMNVPRVPSARGGDELTRFNKEVWKKAYAAIETIKQNTELRGYEKQREIIEKRASKTIFYKLNNHQTLSEGIIDLHGQQTEHAISILEEWFRRMSWPEQRRPVLVITGAGVHSAGAPGKLCRFVEGWLKGIFEYPYDSRAYPSALGTFRVLLPARAPEDTEEEGAA